MQVSIIELNDRRNDVIIVNGYRVDLRDITLTGSDKQIAWATKIIESETLISVEAFVSAKAKHAGHSSNLLSRAEVDQWLGEINSVLSTQATVKLQGASAGKIIEARDRGLPGILKAI